jgi:hypothetical protein
MSTLASRGVVSMVTDSGKCYIMVAVCVEKG